jgi:hypothetical protein
MSLPPLVFFSLTPEKDDHLYPQSPQDYYEETNWIDDSECQENLFHIVSLTPEETIIDEDNHCIDTSYHLFFEELGYLTEEPESIDPTRDYEKEAIEFLNQRDNKKVVRQKHVDLSRIPSLEYSSSTRSGLSSSSSSTHHEHHLIDIRSPHYMGNQHFHSTTTDSTANNSTYHYSHGCDSKIHYFSHHHLQQHQQYRPSRLH